MNVSPFGSNLFHIYMKVPITLSLVIPVMAVSSLRFATFIWKFTGVDH